VRFGFFLQDGLPKITNVYYDYNAPAMNIMERLTNLTDDVIGM